jgi:uncharacterized protein YmfQ (DUF2313 family)
MAMSEADYLQQLRLLLPPGPAFDFELQPDVAQLLSGIAPELARVDALNDQLLLEQIPATVTWLLPEWEAYLGLPDICTVPGSQTLEERRQAVVNKLTAKGAPQRSFYIRLADQAGAPITIDEFQQARVGTATVGDFLYGDDWHWSWLASADSAAFGTEEAAALNCRLQLTSPDYTEVVLGFGKANVAKVTAAVDQLFNATHYVTAASVAGLEG